MFGYVTVNRPELKVKDLELYRSYYCGLCAQLHRQYGRAGQMLLSYDCTFLILLLTGLYEPDEEVKMRRCLVHPAVVHAETSNRFTQYAADMNVLLGFMKAADDWMDEKKNSARLMTALLHESYTELKKKYPRQERAVRTNIRKLRRGEKYLLHLREDKKRTERTDSGRGGKAASGQEELTRLLLLIDRMAACTGNFLGEIYAAEDDMWAGDLRRTGFYLGKFIYLMDAYDDMEEDRKRGNCNVFLELKELQPDGFDERVKGMLLDTAACCCRSFEHLPIIKNAAVLRNILYSGIWVRYNRIAGGTDTDNRDAADPGMPKWLSALPGASECGGRIYERSL